MSYVIVSNINEVLSRHSFQPRREAGSIQFFNHQTRGSTHIVMGQVSKDCVIALAVEVGKDCRTLGIVLGLEDRVVERISQNYKTDVWEKAYRILREWQEQNGSEATYDVLAKALRNQTVGRVDLAEKCQKRMRGDTRNANGKTSFARNCIRNCKICVPPQ